MNATLSTLASETVIKASAAAISHGLHWIGVDVLVSMKNATADQGPLLVGIAQDQLTVTEIKEALNAAPTGPNDVTAIEHSRRRVRVLGYLRGSAVAEDIVLNNGRMNKIRKMRISLDPSENLPSFFVMNKSGAVLTTGAIVEFQATHYGTWE